MARCAPYEHRPGAVRLAAAGCEGDRKYRYRELEDEKNGSRLQQRIEIGKGVSVECAHYELSQVDGSDRDSKSNRKHHAQGAIDQMIEPFLRPRRENSCCDWEYRAGRKRAECSSDEN